MNAEIARPKILIVDDVASNRLAVRTVLKNVDAELLEADNGFDAVSLCLVEDFALILLDVQMPDMDGFEVCEQLRANPQTSELPIIFLTAAYRADEDKIHGYLSGATDYLAKPVNDRILRSKVEVFLKLHRQHNALLAANELLRLEVEQRKRAEERLELLARTDPLTEIFNRRAFFEQGKLELERLHRYGHPSSLAVLDIDHFKQVNDSYGHAVGDQALRLLTQVIASRLRVNDVFARVGGEEFAILLVQMSLPEAAGKIGELLDAMRQTEFSPAGRQETICFSAGVSQMQVEDRSVDDVFARADKLLYRAKMDGRACVRF